MSWARESYLDHSLEGGISFVARQKLPCSQEVQVDFGRVPLSRHEAVWVESPTSADSPTIFASDSKSLPQARSVKTPKL